MSLTFTQRRMQELSGRHFIDGQALPGTTGDASPARSSPASC